MFYVSVWDYSHVWCWKLSTIREKLTKFWFPYYVSKILEKKTIGQIKTKVVIP